MGLWRLVVRHTSRLLRAPTRLSLGETRLDKDQIGRLGEAIAARHLYAHGAKILYRNFRAKGGGEVDLVARHGHVLCFAEVKTRTSDAYGRPADAVTLAKQELISRGAKAWLQLLQNPSIVWRCDIVEVYLQEGVPPRVIWLQHAFEIAELEGKRSRNWTRKS
jgi:putative endonuclease